MRDGPGALKGQAVGKVTEAERDDIMRLGGHNVHGEDVRPK